MSCVLVLIALAIGLVVWCIWRFFKKKRPKDKKKGKDGKDQVKTGLGICSFAL